MESNLSTYADVRERMITRKCKPIAFASTPVEKITTNPDYNYVLIFSDGSQMLVNYYNWREVFNRYDLCSITGSLNCAYVRQSIAIWHGIR